MMAPGKVMKRWWGTVVRVGQYEWPVLVLFGVLCLPVDVSAFSPVSRLLIGVCLLVGFVASVILIVCCGSGRPLSNRGMGGN